MDYGVVMFPTGYSIAPDELARALEARGFESVWFPEHTHIPASRKSPWPGGGELPRDYWSAYDAMNRQVVAEGVLGTAATGVPGVQREYGYVTINSTQGTYLAYDTRGNRTLETRWGTKLSTSSEIVGFKPWLMSGGQPYYPFTTESGQAVVFPLDDLGYEVATGRYYIKSQDSWNENTVSHYYIDGYDHEIRENVSASEGFVEERYTHDAMDRLTAQMRGPRG